MGNTNYILYFLQQDENQVGDDKVEELVSKKYLDITYSVTDDIRVVINCHKKGEGHTLFR